MHPPIFIIGTGRSERNFLPDEFCYFPELITWPCDEINLIFRHGNKHLTHDEFGAEQARPKVSAFVRFAFEKATYDRLLLLCEKIKTVKLYTIGNQNI